jgi:hypothetical protein
MIHGRMPWPEWNDHDDPYTANPVLVHSSSILVKPWRVNNRLQLSPQLSDPLLVD